MPRCCPSHRIQLWLVILTICVSYAGADILIYSAVGRHEIEEEFRDMPSRFGNKLPAEGLKGMVVYADPPTACQEIPSPPFINASYDGRWIALIARYNCSFEMKVRMAQQAGYDAVIVHNVNSNELQPMYANTSIGIAIPSVFVGEAAGKIIRDNYQYDQQYFVLINDDLPFNINTHLLLPFAIVVGICFLVMVIFMVMRCIKDRRRQRRHRLPNSSLKKIPTHKYTKGDPYETCAICLDDYVEGEKLRVLPCAHAYHCKCIDPWLTKNRRVCPVCKRKVFAADEHVSDSESDTDADDSTPLIRDGHPGTQGGTFIPQAENPFRRALNGESFNSCSDSESTSSSSDGEGRGNTGETSGVTVFMVSDSHSINGEPTESENSTNVVKPDSRGNWNIRNRETVAPVAHVTPTRNPRVLVNPVAPNSGHPIILPANPLPIPTILPINPESNDFAPQPL